MKENLYYLYKAEKISMLVCMDVLCTIKVKILKHTPTL